MPWDAIVGPIFQVSIILGIVYAWTLGFNRLSKFRAGNAKTMSEEFLVYGLPEWSLYVIGGELNFGVSYDFGLSPPALFRKAHCRINLFGDGSGSYFAFED